MQQAAFNIDSPFLLSTLDLAKPLWALKLYQPYDQIDIKEMTQILAMGEQETVGNLTGVHYELDRPTTYFQAGAIGVVAGAQNIQTLPLAAGLVNADGTSAVRVGDILQDNVTRASFQVDSKSGANPPVVTLRPLQTGVVTPIASGRILSYVTRSEKERSSAPDQLVRGTTAYSWYTQITRAYQDLSGTAANIELKPASLSSNGQSIQGWTTIQTRDTEAQMLREQFGAFMFGQNTASAQANTAISLSTTQGMDQVVSQRGWNMNIGATALVYADLVTATNNIKAQAASQFYEVWSGAKRSAEINAFLTAQQANSMNPAMDKMFEKMFFGSETQIETLRSTYVWSTTTVNNINFAFKELNFLNNPTTFNVTQTPASMYQNLVYFMPKGQTDILVEGGKKVRSNFVTVLNRGRYSDRWMLIERRGFGSGSTNDGIDHKAYDFLIDFGYRYVMMNAFGRIY